MDAVKNASRAKMVANLVLVSVSKNLFVQRSNCNKKGRYGASIVLASKLAKWGDERERWKKQ